MSWSIRDPPSPVSLSLREIEEAPRTDTPLEFDCRPCSSSSVRACSPPPACLPPSAREYPLRPAPPLCMPGSPRVSSPSHLTPPPPNITLEIVGQEQWSTNPLQVKSTFAILGEPGIRVLSSAAWGMGWSSILDLRPATISTRRGGRNYLRKTDPSVVAVHASLQSGPGGFPLGGYSIHTSFRREGAVLALLENVHEDFSFPKQSTISLGRCNITLPLGEIFIDLVVTLSLPDSEPSSEVPRSISASMSKAIRATLDGEFPVDIKFMLFSRKLGTSVHKLRPIHASRNILKGRNSFLDSYMNDSHVGGDHLPASYQYPYDEDSDLESDEDEVPGAVPRSSDSILIEDPHTPSVQISELDKPQPGPSESPRGSTLSGTSIFDVDTDLPSIDSPAKSYCSLITKDPEHFEMSDSICISEYQSVSPTCDVVSKPVGRCAEEYKVMHQDKILASLLPLALINDVAFRTFRAFILYMYTKEVAFIPLQSSGGRSYNIGDACSPKSMYRLAVKANHESLKKHAFDNLQSQLGPQNIITEIFSEFTGGYPEIFEMELKVLLNHFTDPAVRDEWERMIDKVASGQLPHSADVLKRVTRALSLRGVT